MTTHVNSSLRWYLQAIFNAGTLVRLSDGQLLEQFVTHPHEADHAFQATFLILLSQTGSIRKHEPLSPWLYDQAASAQ